MTVVMTRLLISSFCFWLFLRFSKDRQPWSGRLIELIPPKIWLLSLAGCSLHYWTQTLGLSMTTPDRASIYAATGPIVILLIGRAFLGERLGRRKILGILLAMAGALVVSMPELLIPSSSQLVTSAALQPGRPDFQMILGDLLVLLSIALWACFTVGGKSLSRTIPAHILTARMTYAGTLTVIPIALLESGGSLSHLWNLPAQVWGALAFLGIGCSFGATLLYMKALKNLEAGQVGAFLYTVPPMTCLLTWLQGGMPPQTGVIIGGLTVLAGVWLSESRTVRNPAESGND